MQSTVTHDQLYWLAVPNGHPHAGALVIASRNAQTTTIEKCDGPGRLNILLNDQMMDLDQPVKLEMNGHELFHGIVKRTLAQQYESLERRGDPFLVFDAALSVQLRGT